MSSLSPRPAVLLLADDDRDTRIVFGAALRSRGHTVIEARDGAECLRLAATRSFDLVTVDLLMPTLDGFAVIERLRAAETTAHTPIVAITAMAEAAARERAIGLGCDRVLLKPLSPRTLLEEVERMLAGAARAQSAAGALRRSAPPR